MKRKFLPLNLQYFSQETPEEQPELNTEQPSSEETQKPDNKIPYDRFKQKVDEANELKRQLADFQKQQEEAERKKLEQQQEFKSLYEQTQAELERLKTEAQTATIEKAKTDLLVQAGYTGEQLDRVRKYLHGTDEDSLKASLDEVKADIPPKSSGVDPSVGNTPKQQPKQKDAADTGRSLYQRLKEAGKIRR
jgi:molecular chaperone GrpE (heat shock protein)